VFARFAEIASDPIVRNAEQNPTPSAWLLLTELRIRALPEARGGR